MRVFLSIARGVPCVATPVQPGCGGLGVSSSVVIGRRHRTTTASDTTMNRRIAPMTQRKMLTKKLPSRYGPARLAKKL